MAASKLRPGVNLPPGMWVVNSRIWLMTWLSFDSIALTTGWVIHSHMLINALKATCTIHLSFLVSHLPKHLFTELEESTTVWTWTCFNWLLQVGAWFCVRLTWGFQTGSSQSTHSYLCSLPSNWKPPPPLMLCFRAYYFALQGMPHWEKSDLFLWSCMYIIHI